MNNYCQVFGVQETLQVAFHIHAFAISGLILLLQTVIILAMLVKLLSKYNKMYSTFPSVCMKLFSVTP